MNTQISFTSNHLLAKDMCPTEAGFVAGLIRSCHNLASRVLPGGEGFEGRRTVMIPTKDGVQYVEEVVEIKLPSYVSRDEYVLN